MVNSGGSATILGILDRKIFTVRMIITAIPLFF
jgi:hypothetical protein